MIKSDELKGPSCLTRAAADEPLFVLRANDELAPSVVLWWADRYALSKGGYNKLTSKQRAKCDEASALARKMEIWKANHA
jgi:hypothetical protein